MKPKKKFPLPRPGSRRFNKATAPDDARDPPSGSESSGDSNLSLSASGRIRSLTPLGFGGRRPSFRFGRKNRSKSSPQGVDEDVGSSGANSSPNVSIGSDGTGGGSSVGHVSLPPALPTTAAADGGDARRIQQHVPMQTPLTPMAGADKTYSFSQHQTFSQDSFNYTNQESKQPHAPSESAGPLTPQQQQQQQQQQQPTLPLTRSLTPSDVHYHTSHRGGCNASLTPISQHYQANESLLDIFSTLYEKEQFNVAYAVGIKFVEVALFQIPVHGYFRSGSASKERTKSAADALHVTKMLGGMVDEMEDDNEGRGGFEKVEKLNKLASVAQKSLDEALDEELNGSERNRGERDKNGAAAQVSRIWNEYIMGAGDGFENSNMCSMPHLPDNLCSFLNIGGHNKNKYAAVDDTVIEEDSPAKKRSKIDRKSLPPHPEPVEIPQVFIKKYSESMDEDTSPAESARPVQRGVASDREPPSAFEEDMKEETPYDEREDARPMEVDLITPKTRPSKSKTDAADATRPRAESALSIITESAPTAAAQSCGESALPIHTEAAPTAVDQSLCESTPSISMEHTSSSDYDKVEPNVVVQGRHIEQPHDVRNVVSSSSEDAQSTTANGQNYGNIASLASLYQEQYQALRGKHKFHVRFLDTFQGRNPKSTNGCTVIAPLTCIQYFTSHEQNSVTSTSHDESTVWKNGIPDDLINQVIDEHAAIVVPEVRNKLNLEQDAFIIPSDVHDHLIDEGLLSTSQFVGVCGGNVLDDEHLSAFKRTLLLLDDEGERKRLNGRKIGATFFFHGHVIALHVINNGRDDVWIELIDSLPNPETWISCPHSASSNHASKSSSHMSEDTDEERERPMEYPDEDMIQNAIRVRCTDVEHFDTLVRHYVCSKFSSEEKRFIDTTEWEDNAGYCEYSFDPRVFQAFIWAEAE